MAVPRVTMDQAGVDVRCVEVRASSHRPENGAQRFRASEIARVDFVTGDLEIAFLNTLIAKATNFHRHYLRQFARKIADVNARAAINVRRILVGEEKNFHELLPRAHEQHRHLRFVPDFVDRAAEKKIAEQTMPVRRHRDQIAFSILRSLQDSAGWIAER